jgi:hypothetical protein
MLLRELLYGHCQADMAVLRYDWLCLSWSEPWRLLTSSLCSGGRAFPCRSSTSYANFQLGLF